MPRREGGIADVNYWNKTQWKNRKAARTPPCATGLGYRFSGPRLVVGSSREGMCHAAYGVAGWGAAVLRPYLEAACFAALWPHMPWTPPPGGVDEEQM